MSRRVPRPRPTAPSPESTSLPPIGSPMAYRLVLEARRRSFIGEADCDGGKSARQLFASWAGLDADAPADLRAQAAPDVRAAWSRHWHQALRDLLRARQGLA